MKPCQENTRDVNLKQALRRPRDLSKQSKKKHQKNCGMDHTSVAIFHAIHNGLHVRLLRHLSQYQSYTLAFLKKMQVLHSKIPNK